MQYCAAALAFLLCFTAVPSFAGGLTQFDQGTFAILGKDNAPTGYYYHLSRVKGVWRVASRKANTPWSNADCGPGCEFQDASDADIQHYFPLSLRTKMDLACIKSTALAFCRYTPKGQTKLHGHVVILLTGGTPAPVFLRQVPTSSVK